MSASSPASPDQPAKANVYQIFYNEETRQSLNHGFIPLDNIGQRPDWCEYWPIRNFLLKEPLNEDEFYGFLSPKFGLKTGLSARQIEAFVATTAADVDVISFSPWFDEGVWHQNIFEQGEHHHPEAARVFQAGVDLIAPGVDLKTLITDSSNTIFCNYFLARPRFWRHWLDKAEIIFALAEKDDTPLGHDLNTFTTYQGASAFQTKVFFIERLASLLLATERRWKMRFYDPMILSVANQVVNLSIPELLALDTIKQQAASQQGEERLALLQIWRQVREAIERKYE
jgi:hypothetical protein